MMLLCPHDALRVSADALDDNKMLWWLTVVGEFEDTVWLRD
jgi:hypothetical protein